ncbi:hypothetical protein STENM36S_04614 [Streptomyces tendae]
MPWLYDWNLYGPEENGCRPYLDLVSLSWRTGEAEVSASTSSKSELAFGSLKTMVLSSGVSIAFRPSLSFDLSLYGPWYVPSGSSTSLRYVGPPDSTSCAHTRSMPYLTSLEVIGLPSSQVTPSRRVYV